jgi:Zn-finger nucleic acid-binding protein
MKLVACPSCRAQYDVTGVAAKHFECRCGETVENRDLGSVDAAAHRCGSCGALVGADAAGCAYCGSDIVRDPRRLSLICPECYARNPDACRFCTACGIAFRPEPVPGDEIELPCPCCGCLMPVRRAGGVALNECPRCNGLWVPDDRFDELVERAIEARRARDPQAAPAPRPRVTGANPATQRVVYRRCPVCEAQMQRRNFQRRSGVILDVCRAHGTWLDADELEQIAGFILSGGLAAAQEREAELRRAEERRDAARAQQQALRRTGLESLAAPAGSGRPIGSFGSLGDLLDFLLS